MREPYYDAERQQWRVGWMENGKRRSKRFDTKSEALRFTLDFEEGTADTAPVRERALTFSDFVDRWRRDYSRVEKSESTWANDDSLIEHHLAPYIGPIRIADLTGAHLDAVKGEMKRKRGLRWHGKKMLSNKTINTTLLLAKQIMGCAVRWQRRQVPVNPFEDVRLLKVPKRTFAYWTVAEREAFLAEAWKEDEGVARLVTVATHTGLRSGELQALTGESLDWARLKITVAASWSSRLRKLLPTKNGEIAEVPMNAAVVEALSAARFAPRAQLVFDRSLFHNPRRWMNRLAFFAGVSAIRFHDLRHTFASTLAMAGIDLMQIQQLMRHKSYQQTLRYAHLRPDHLKGATDCLVAPKALPAELREA